MSRFTVTATPKAESDLARLWLASTDRRAVSDAANKIDRDLRDDAPQKGFDAGRGFRQLIISPLVAEFTVAEDDRVVTIWSIRHIGELTNGS
jgi:hypothetical protein